MKFSADTLTATRLVTTGTLTAGCPDGGTAEVLRWKRRHPVHINANVFKPYMRHDDRYWTLLRYVRYRPVAEFARLPLLILPTNGGHLARRFHRLER